MTEKQMLARLNALIKQTNVYCVMSALGYRSPNTILGWLKSDRIPKVAIDKVHKFLKGSK